MGSGKLSRREFLWLGGFGVTAAVTLGACSPTPGANSGGTETPEGQVSKDVSDKGPVTLNVWDFNTGPLNALQEQLNREFQEKYPNVTIKRTAKTFVDLTGTLKLAMSGENPPDAATVNQGWPDMGTMVQGGLLRPLDDYAEAYGWKDRYPSSVLQQSSFTKDGKEFGTGSLFGLPFAAGSGLGVYYNKATLEGLGLQVPQSFEEFEETLEQARQAGEIAIQMGNLDKIGMLIAYELTQEASQTSAQLRDLIFGRSGATFDTPENLQAASTVQRWAESGYFTEGFNGLSPEDARGQFAMGEGLYTLAGTQDWPTLAQGSGEEAGFFLVPPENAGDPRDATGSAYATFSISSKSKNADVAAAYLEFISNERASQAALKNDLPPLSPPDDLPAAARGTVFADVLEAQRQLLEEDTFVPYLDWATPDFYDLLTTNLQELAAGRITPDQFVTEAQGEYASFHKG
jgi:raffinose/stachyose/melibiose transport system substrate-binding protein